MHRNHVRVRVSLGVVCMALAFALAPAAVAATHGGRPAKHRRIPLKDRPIAVAVSAEGGEAGAPVPQDFLGLSFEVGSLAQIGAYAGEGDLVSMLRSLGTGVLRFGGVTADEQIAWREGAEPRPSWALGSLEAGNLAQLGSGAAQSGWDLLLTLGCGHFEAEAAAREAAAAKATLGSSLEA